MSATPLATVAVPLYNDADTIGPCLEALLAQDIAGQLEILVVDDGSTDDSAVRAAAYPVRVVRQANGGPAAARNTGAREARGEFVLFLDSDSIAAPDWARRMLAPFADPAVVAVTGGVASATWRVLPELVQLEIDERYRLMSRVRYVDFFASVAVGFRRGYFLDLGGFREDFRYNEDVELAYRIHGAGGRIVFVPRPPVLHPHPTRWRSYFLTKFWRGVWRMRLYRLYPRKAVADNWTPQSLKLQILAAGVLPVALLGGFVHPAGWWLALLAGAGFLWSARGLLAAARRRGGAALQLAAVPFLAVRALALGCAILWNLLPARLAGDGAG